MPISGKLHLVPYLAPEDQAASSSVCVAPAFSCCVCVALTSQVAALGSSLTVGTHHSAHRHFPSRPPLGPLALPLSLLSPPALPVMSEVLFCVHGFSVQHRLPQDPRQWPQVRPFPPGLPPITLCRPHPLRVFFQQSFQDSKNTCPQFSLGQSALVSAQLSPPSSCFLLLPFSPL